jgi:hypothetical protein
MLFEVGVILIIVALLWALLGAVYQRRLLVDIKNAWTATGTDPDMAFIASDLGVDLNKSRGRVRYSVTVATVGILCVILSLIGTA